MNWEIIGATGEWAGAIVVVATLFYLARQVRQNTRASRAGASYAINDSLSKIVGAIRSDREFADIWIRGCEDIDALNPVERVLAPPYSAKWLCQDIEIPQQLESGSHLG